MLFSTPYAKGIILLFIMALAPQALNAFYFLLNYRLGLTTFESPACTASADSQHIPTM